MAFPIILRRISPAVSRPRRVDAAGLFEPPRVAAPIAAAVFAVPLGHAFPFFSVGKDSTADVNGVLECWSYGVMDHRDDLIRATFGAVGSHILEQRFSITFRCAFCSGRTLGTSHLKYPRSR